MHCCTAELCLEICMPHISHAPHQQLPYLAFVAQIVDSPLEDDQVWGRSHSFQQAPTRGLEGEYGEGEYGSEV